MQCILQVVIETPIIADFCRPFISADTHYVSLIRSFHHAAGIKLVTITRSSANGNNGQESFIINNEGSR